MTEQPTARQVIRAAVAAAGGHVKAAKALGISSPAISGWCDRGTVPPHHIAPLCALGRHVVSVQQLVEAMARDAAERRAA